jgi:hypothetical protein
VARLADFVARFQHLQPTDAITFPSTTASEGAEAERWLDGDDLVRMRVTSFGDLGTEEFDYWFIGPQPEEHAVLVKEREYSAPVSFPNSFVVRERTDTLWFCHGVEDEERGPLGSLARLRAAEALQAFGVASTNVSR